MADEPDESLANVEAQPDETRSDESPTPKNLEPEEVLQFLRMTDFDSVRCTRESERLDFKSGWYRLEEEHEKLELAKDVAAFANANGGYIVRGVKTKRLHTADEEVAWELKPIPHAMVDLAQHKAAIAKYVYPPVKVVLEWVPTSDTHGLLTIIVPPHDVGQRPFLLTKNVDRGDTIVQMFSLPVRDGAATAFEPPGLIWRDISDGRRARAEPSRLSSRPSIEESTPSAIGSDWARDRFEVAIEEIEAFMGWGSSESVFALAAAPGSPGRYAPRDFRAVDGLAGAMRDLNSPRYAGFGLTYGESPEQVGSALVVNSARQRYVRVEPTGLAVAATATSGDFLTWASRTRFAESAPLTINAVVVVEYTYLFCRFTFEQLQSRFEGQWEFCITLRRAQSATAPLRMKDHWPNGFEQYKSMSDVLMEWIPAEETAEKTALQLVSRLWDFYSLPRDSVPLTVDSEIDTAALFAQG